MALAVFAVCERVRLATGAVSRIGGLCDLVRRATGSAGLRGIGLSGGFGMTTLGSGAGVLEFPPLEVFVVIFVQHWIACCSAFMANS